VAAATTATTESGESNRNTVPREFVPGSGLESDLDIGTCPGEPDDPLLGGELDEAGLVHLREWNCESEVRWSARCRR